MDRKAIVAVVKLAACVAVAAALVLIWIFGGDLWYRPIAAVAFIIVGAPVVLLVSIDTCKVLRRHRLSPVATIATRIPQYILGVMAVAGGLGGLGMAVLHITDPHVLSFGLFFFSVALLVYGINTLFNPDADERKKN